MNCDICNKKITQKSHTFPTRHEKCHYLELLHTLMYNRKVQLPEEVERDIVEAIKGPKHKVCSSKYCDKQGEPQDLGMFTKNKTTPDGLCRVCIRCARKQGNLWQKHKYAAKVHRMYDGKSLCGLKLKNDNYTFDLGEVTCERCRDRSN